MFLDIFSGHFFPGEVVFLLLCLAAAWMFGKSVATDWKPLLTLVVGILVLGLGARFLHFALYEAQFVSPMRYVIDTFALMITGFLGYRFKRTAQMTTQYHWLYEKASAFTWRERAH